MKKVLFIGYVWPEPNTTAAGHRMIQLLSTFKKQGFAVIFATTASKTPYSENLEHIGIETKTIALNDSSFDVFVKGLNPDVVIFDRFMIEEQFGWRVVENVPRALRILNTEDLHSLRNTRENCHKKGKEFSNDLWLQNDLTKREIASIYRSDMTLIISPFEMQLLKEKLGIADQLLYHLPFLLNPITEEVQNKWPIFEERKDFICFGNGKHTPNVNAIKYLKHEIWPLLRKKLPKAKLHVYGAYLPQQISEMHHERDGFLVHGWIKDLDTELCKAKVNLAPLHFGAGIKGKLTQAMENGTPNITTNIGTEGMHSSFEWAGNIVENTEDFVEKGVELYQDKTLWEQKQQNGVKIINGLYSKEILAKALFKTLEDHQDNLKTYRNQNFIGSMLQHQTMASTKFMSKWIEEKNKN